VPPPIPDINLHIDNPGPVVTREVRAVAIDATSKAIPIGLLAPYLSDNDPPTSRANILPIDDMKSNKFYAYNNRSE